MKLRTGQNVAIHRYREVNELNIRHRLSDVVVHVALRSIFRNLCSERKLSGRGLFLKACGQLVHDTSPM
jgi:hypothetical protein